MRLVTHLDKLGVDPHPVVGAAHAAFQDVVHAEFAADFVDPLGGVFVLQGRRSGNDSQPLRP